MKNNIKNILIISFTTIITVGLIVALILINEQRKDSVCNNIHLTVSDYDKFKFVSETEINKHLKNTDLYPIGKLHSEIDLTGMEQELMKMKMVDKVICSYTNNGDVKVEVKQRVPKFRVKEVNQDYYVDNNRHKMPTSIKFSAYVPVVTGNIEFEFASQELYDFICYIESKRRWSSAFTQIYVYPNEKVQLIPRVGDFIVNIGKLDNYENKLKKLDIFLEELPKYYSWDKYSMINLEYKNQVVCTKKR